MHLIIIFLTRAAPLVMVDRQEAFRLLLELAIDQHIAACTKRRELSPGYLFSCGRCTACREADSYHAFSTLYFPLFNRFREEYKHGEG